MRPLAMGGTYVYCTTICQKHRWSNDTDPAPSHRIYLCSDISIDSKEKQIVVVKDIWQICQMSFFIRIQFSLIFNRQSMIYASRSHDANIATRRLKYHYRTKNSSRQFKKILRTIRENHKDVSDKTYGRFSIFFKTIFGSS